jgi:hypothetical protein
VVEQGRTRSPVEGDGRIARPRLRRCPTRAYPVGWQGDGAVTGAEGDQEPPWQTDGRERSVRRPNSCTDFRATRRHHSVEGTADGYQTLLQHDSRRR